MNAMRVGEELIAAALTTELVASNHGNASETPNPRKMVRRDNLEFIKLDILTS